jgi:hypothetical protein
MDNFSTIYPIYKYITADSVEVKNKEPSSFDFEKLKQFYGNLFELLSESFIIPSCINNLLEGRNFDAFNSMDLDTYLKIDKANRYKPFYNNIILSILSEEFNNKLRNASHHGNISYDVNSRQILYCSGRPLKEYRMKSTEYLISVSKILVNIFRIHMIGLFLEEHYKYIDNAI